MAPFDVEPSPSGHDRYRRNWLIEGFGRDGQDRLSNAQVLVVGAGGLGSAVLPYLVAAGVGRIGVCDSDRVEVSNLQRQVLFTEGDIGRTKSVVAVDRLAALNSEIRIEHFEHITPQWLGEHGRQWDVIVECTDTFDAKYMIADWCRDSGVPLVWGTVVAMSFQTSVFWSAPPPGMEPTCLRDLHPHIPAEGTTASSIESGVLGSVVGQVGTIMATEAIKLIVGFGQPLIGRVLVGDALRQRYDVVPFAAPRHHRQETL